MAHCWTCGNKIRTPMWRCSDCPDALDLEMGYVWPESNSVRLGRVSINQIDAIRLTRLRDVKRERLATAVIQAGEDIHCCHVMHESQFSSWVSIEGDNFGMARELAGRGDYQNALLEYEYRVQETPLWYHGYVGLARTQLILGYFREAKKTIEDSKYHALGGLPEHSFKSYNDHLLARISYCQGDYERAYQYELKAYEASKDYSPIAYALAQYAALTGRGKSCLSLLDHVLRMGPLYWYTARYERNFIKMSGEVGALLESFYEKRCSYTLATFKKIVPQYNDYAKEAKQLHKDIALLSKDARASEVIKEFDAIQAVWTRLSQVLQPARPSYWNMIDIDYPLRKISSRLTPNLRALQYKKGKISTASVRSCSGNGVICLLGAGAIV